LNAGSETGHGDSDEGICRSVAKSLAQTLNDEVVLIGRLVGTPADRISTLAVYRKGQRLENFEFPLANTFGEELLRKADAVYRPCARWALPIAPGEGLEISSFAGCPIVDDRGKPMGLLVVLASGPLSRPGVIKSLLQIYANRAAAQMERHHTEERLRLLSLAIEHSPASVVITDANARIQYVNKRFVELTGYSPEEVHDRNPRILKSGQTPRETYKTLWGQLRAGKDWRGHFLNRKKNGDLFWEEASISPLLDNNGAITHFVAVKEDITDRKRLEAQIWHQANYDNLTDLPNRLLFLDRLQQALRQADRDQTKTALLFIDLDRFKTVNDTLGHEVGDDMLREMARRIRSCVRTDDTVARMGGDEFTVILPRVKDGDGAGKVAGKILATLREPFLLRDRRLLMTASIGVAIYPDHGQNYTSLLKHADTAMYQVKEGGRNDFRFHLAPAGTGQPASGD
jgi:diguanylate cyclase (GGDEF)-like protein/PAS domain S-box-containing protein